jgi:hypothetical protein
MKWSELRQREKKEYERRKEGSHFGSVSSVERGGGEPSLAFPKKPGFLRFLIPYSHCYSELFAYDAKMNIFCLNYENTRKCVVDK